MDVNVDGIGILNGLLDTNGLAATQQPVLSVRTNNQIFNDFLEAASGIYQYTNSSLNDMQSMQLQVAAGESDDFIGLTLMQSKANASMQFFTQLTSKTIEAYREIMRMPV